MSVRTVLQYVLALPGLVGWLLPSHLVAYANLLCSLLKSEIDNPTSSMSSDPNWFQGLAERGFRSPSTRRGGALMLMLGLMPGQAN